ncbi:hypothetical protein TorRG33x02_352670 [Trema orientale]|uniref:Uncharacterized protein n=1 Tax=Trema orientale TaxID=63057 RepID=A0A2P5AE26_TREOI|nr:hypothetical protein TorRG33x02_352670 [Trema orientale]
MGHCMSHCDCLSSRSILLSSKLCSSKSNAFRLFFSSNNKLGTRKAFYSSLATLKLQPSWRRQFGRLEKPTY